jgi:hypothetical protein
LKLLFLLKDVRLLKIGARVAGVRHQLLPVRTAFELRNHRVCPARLFVRAPGKNQKGSGNKNGDSEENRHANFQSAFQRECVAGHFFGDRKRLKSSLRHFAALVGDAGFLAQFIQDVFLAQLYANARQQLHRLPG